MSTSSGEINVVCVGAGYAGLALARSILENAPGAALTIYETDDGVGGVWRKTSYPGAGSDFPSHLYALPWALNPDWARFYSTRPEILSYLERVAEQSGFLPYIRFGHKVEHAIWQEQEGLWAISGTRTSTHGQEQWHAKAHVLVNSGGILSTPNAPSLSGVESYQGRIVHTSQWDDTISVENKRVAVIGAGASAIQILPALQHLGVGHIDLYVRSQAWIGTPFNFAERDANFNQEAENFATLFTDDADVINPTYPEEQRDSLRHTKGDVEKHRKWLEEGFHGSARDLYTRDSPMSHFVRDALTGLARAKLAAKPELESSFLPDFSFGCRRPTPGPGFFETITRSNVDVIQAGVDRLTQTGIVADGDDKERPVDLVILATGYKVNHVPPFEVTGRSGSSLGVDWSKNPRGYLSLAAPGMPNYFTIAGPQHPSANGSLISSYTLLSDYIAKAVVKLQSLPAGASLAPKTSAINEFCNHSDDFMKTQVWTQGCNSWYKNSEGRITTNWPGTFLHFADTISNPRWGDYDWQQGPASLEMLAVQAEGSLKALLADGRSPNEPPLGVMGPSPAPYLDGRLASMYDIKRFPLPKTTAS